VRVCEEGGTYLGGYGCTGATCADAAGVSTPSPPTMAPHPSRRHPSTMAPHPSPPPLQQWPSPLPTPPETMAPLPSPRHPSTMAPHPSPRHPSTMAPHPSPPPLKQWPLTPPHPPFNNRRRGPPRRHHPLPRDARDRSPRGRLQPAAAGQRGAVRLRHHGHHAYRALWHAHRPPAPLLHSSPAGERAIEGGAPGSAMGARRCVCALAAGLRRRVGWWVVGWRVARAWPGAWRAGQLRVSRLLCRVEGASRAQAPARACRQGRHHLGHQTHAHTHTTHTHTRTCSQGHIALDSVVYPEGTPGCAIDALARVPLWADGLNYRHGTGHGVGAALNVHEGPQSISSRRAPVRVWSGLGGARRSTRASRAWGSMATVDCLVSSAPWGCGWAAGEAAGWPPPPPPHPPLSAPIPSRAPQVLQHAAADAHDGRLQRARVLRGRRLRHPHREPVCGGGGGHRLQASRAASPHAAALPGTSAGVCPAWHLGRLLPCLAPRPAAALPGTSAGCCPASPRRGPRCPPFAAPPPHPAAAAPPLPPARPGLAGSRTTSRTA
jgi:hypothetical protein